MGHERVGRLPKSERWRTIVAAVAQEPGSSAEVHALASATLENVQDRFTNIASDTGVQAAFRYLVALAQPADTPRPEGVPDLSSNPSPLRLAASLHSFISDHTHSGEYAALAQQAGADAIAEWHRTRSSEPQLFEESKTAAEVWSGAASGGAFSEVARAFFASFTERYIKYFLDREASATLPTVHAREAFDDELRRQVGRVSRHAFETSKITQSFAAGWYNKHARGHVPSPVRVRGFLAIAFGKMREELRREAAR